MAVFRVFMRWVSLLYVYFFVALQSYGQNITKYAFSTSTGNGYSALTGATTPALIGGGDDGYVNNIDIGFDFWYMGELYDKVSASTNGWFTLGSSIGGSMPVNNLTSGGTRPVIAPLWDDLKINPGILNLLLPGSFSYRLSGTEPNRVLTMQWATMQWDRNATYLLLLVTQPSNVVSFQARIYENGNIEFIYSSGPQSVSNGSASVGITAIETGAGNFISVSKIADGSPVISANSNSETNNINTKPSTGRMIVFNPEETSAPTNLTFTSVGTTGTTLNWTDNSSDEVGFAIYRSLDNANFSYIGQTAANVTSFNSIGLNANTTYYYRVHAIRENLSEALIGYQTTLSVCSISQISTANIVAHYRLNGNALDFYGGNNGALQGGPTAATDRFDIANSAYNFNGVNQYVSTANAYSNPNVFTISVWFKTTVAGGKLIGFGSNQTGFSTNADRHIYMSNDGRIVFGVKPGAVFKTISSPMAYNDGNWHMATAAMSASGMVLYVDGLIVAQDTNVTSGESYGSNGYWRLAYDNLDGWPSTPTNRYFTGSLDDVYIYHRVLSAAEVLRLYRSADEVVSNAPVCVGVNLNLIAPTIPGATYSWTGPAGFTSNQQNPSVIFVLNRTGVYTVTVSFGGCAVSSSTRVIASTITGQWTGRSSTNWNAANNWCNGVVPTDTVNVSLPSSEVVNNPILTATGSVRNISVQSGRTLTIGNGGNLHIAGTLTNSGTIIASSGAVTMNGITAQTIPANAFSGNLIKDLTINNAAGVTLGGTLRLTGLLTANAGVFNANGYLTLASSATSTAQVGQIPTGASIQGNVKVERFLQGGTVNPYRTYRMLSSPVYDNTTNFVSADVPGNRSAKFSQLIDNIIISGTQGAAGGFDVTHNNSPGAWTYTSGFTEIPHINTSVNAGKGMYVFFRGNRDNFEAKTNAPYTNPENTIIDFDGILNQQAVTVILTAGGNFVGNPYAATIDWDSPNWGSDKVNVDDAIWIWSPQDRAYATYINGVGLLGGSRYIASGQSFFVRTTAAGSIKFKENIKASGATQPPVLLMSVPNKSITLANRVASDALEHSESKSLLRIGVKPVASYGRDETVIVFDGGSSTAYNSAEDALHLDGEVVNISSLATGGQKLGINFMAMPSQSAEVFLNVTPVASGNYELHFNLEEYYQAHSLKLKDKYLNRILPLTTDFNYSFYVDRSNQATYGNGRFSILLEPPKVLPIKLITFKAEKQNSGVLLKWTTANEENDQPFKLYRAGADSVFVFVGEVLSKDVGEYLFADTSPLLGYNYYKLTQADTNGSEIEIGTVSINYVLGNTSLVTISPNPVVDNFLIKANGLLSDGYRLILYDLTGKKLSEYKISAKELNRGYKIKIPQLNAGFFFLRVEEQKTERVVFVEKLIKQ